MNPPERDDSPGPLISRAEHRRQLALVVAVITTTALSIIFALVTRTS